jgi:tetratricopeptide (TPR) repeat protein
MKSSRNHAWVLVLAALALACASTAEAAPVEKAAELAASGDMLLAQADFKGALSAYAQAAKTDTENLEYRQTYAMIRRVIKMRPAVDKEKNPAKWEQTVRGLRAFYYEHAIYSEALELDRTVHARLATEASAGDLAETQLTLGLDAEAVATIEAVDAEARTPRTHVLLGIALARQGKMDEAKAVASGIETPEGAWPAFYYDLARLHSLIGDADAATRLLGTCFERTPPSRLAASKDRARIDKDLSAAVASAGFAKVLDTKSKVKESGCSGGTTCGSCPSKAKCGSSTKSASAKKPK